jgi:hypothetical protein
MHSLIKIIAFKTGNYFCAAWFSPRQINAQPSFFSLQGTILYLRNDQHRVLGFVHEANNWFPQMAQNTILYMIQPITGIIFMLSSARYHSAVPGYLARFTSQRKPSGIIWNMAVHGWAFISQALL